MSSSSIFVCAHNHNVLVSPLACNCWCSRYAPTWCEANCTQH